MEPKYRLLCALLLLLALSAVSYAMPTDTGITFIGEFSNMRHTSSHTYGYSVQLWRNNEKVFGFLIDGTGLSGDSPIGALEDVHFNPAEGTLSFTAKLSIESIYMGKGKQEPTHDLFTFKGTLQDGKILSGTLNHVDKLQLAQKPKIERVRLVKTSGRSPIEAATYDEWKQSADSILKFRGPKW